MRSFLTGLQFLTRLHIVRLDNPSMEDFTNSVKFFPLIGAVLGLIYAAAAFILFEFTAEFDLNMPVHFGSAILLAIMLYMTGGLFCDGFMDTMDGLLSGRERERMLEIMKDSRVGASGAMAFVVLSLWYFAALMDLGDEDLYAMLFCLPIISRFMVVYVITKFPYARKEGMGKAFSEVGGGAFWFALVTTLILLLAGGTLAYFAFFAAWIFSYVFASYATKKLGGVTGDVYGAVAMMAGATALLTMILLGSSEAAIELSDLPLL